MKKKLTNYEDDNELIYLVSENSEDANKVIYEKYAPVIDYYAKNYLALVENAGLDYNDLYQEGLLGVISAINSYSTRKDIKFSTFAFMCIRRKMLTAVKNANRKKHSVLNESLSLEYKCDEGKDSFENTLASREQGVLDLLVSKENDECFRRMVDRDLTEFEKMVYEMKVNGFGNNEIATALKRSYKSIDSALCRVRIKLKKILSEIN